MRALRIPEVSQRKLEIVDAHSMALMEDFCDGVNHYIETHRKKLPPEFSILSYEPEDWQPEHSLYIISYQTWKLSMA